MSDNKKMLIAAILYFIFYGVFIFEPKELSEIDKVIKEVKR